MTSIQFDKIVEACCSDIRETLSCKGEVYAGLTDRLQNFKDAATLNGTTPEIELWHFMTKHIIALKDYVTEHDLLSGKNPTEEEWIEKTGDIICYLVLLRGVLVDKNLLPLLQTRLGLEGQG